MPDAREDMLKDYLASVKRRSSSLDMKVHVPKAGFSLNHKVILFGRIYQGRNEDEAELYQFTHQRADLMITEGYIPVGFLSSVPVETTTLYLAVRKGEYGPEYQISMHTLEEVVADWALNPDTMWSSVLSYFDKKALFEEKVLDYLDADPFVLFGIDDPITQKALRKLERQPILLSRGKRPDILEWTDYLGASQAQLNPQQNANDQDAEHRHGERHQRKPRRHKLKINDQMKWIPQAFAEMELPAPWTSYKGVGSIVCFLEHDQGVCTWKHPFYDYFAQLWSYCSSADIIDVMRIRVNRLVWNYEASQLTSAIQQPLISPEYIEQISDIMGFDVSKEPYIVRSLKAALKLFSQNYRMKERIAKEDVLELLERLRQDGARNDITMTTWHETLSNDVTFNLKDLSQGNVMCIECRGTAQSFCLECKDYFCTVCFNKLHLKGHRKEHVPFRLIPCSMCSVMPAKVHCTFTDKSLCHECYAMHHISTLPKDARENAPKTINYAKQQMAIVESHQLQHELKEERPDSATSQLSQDSCASVLTLDWHPFYDSKGIKFFYNFRTGESMRRSPTASAQNSPVGSEAAESGAATPMAEDLQNKIRVEGPRLIRAPYRNHPDACEFKEIDQEKAVEEQCKP
eukprot:GEMP01016858.1.p1 GENE.GEMP01016858.1~~GEMP01016858.1.p1  ORF type:complete len:631 (+),score=114.03 GEMP01016858.1:175-2067(+)